MEKAAQKTGSVTVRVNQEQEDFIAHAIEEYQQVLPPGLKVTKSFVITKLLELGVTAMAEEIKQYAKGRRKTA